MLALENCVQECGLEAKLLDVVKTRASRINGCAYGIDMHSKDAKVLGEIEQRLSALNAWRETPL
jgi:AhpD family alkylhydroperoxidase